ncbi:divisome protein SepX/GlpR [Streptomyces albus]|uniref:divisome protein SepX/GlpR n=1 Tax=Streptomyces albus TaxID=1888 RepID=UPI003D1103C8
MSSSGLIYAVIVGAWAAYLVPMWLRRQDELNEARPTERFSTAIRLLSGKAGMERRYARAAARRRVREGWEAEDPYTPGNDAETGSPSAYGGHDGYDDDAYGNEPDAAGESVDVRAFADPKTMVCAPGSEALTEVLPAARAHRRPENAPQRDTHGVPDGHTDTSARDAHGDSGGSGHSDQESARPSGIPGEASREQYGHEQDERRDHAAEARAAALEGRRAKQAKRAKLLARRRRTTMLLFLAFTVGSVIAAVRGLALLWVPAIPAVLLSTYIAYLRVQERRRFLASMDRRRAEQAARTLHARESRGAAGRSRAADREAAQEADTEPGASARAARAAVREPQRPDAERLSSGRGEPRRDRTPGGAQEVVESTSGASGDAHRADRRTERTEEGWNAQEARVRAREARARMEEQEAAERRALVEQTDHAEWVDQQRARDRDSSDGEGWDPVPVPLPTYVSAPVAPRATRGVDLEAPDAWSSARSSTVPAAEPQPAEGGPRDAEPARPRDRTPLFDQYEDEDRPRAANE